jgi:hypothetical protein
VILVFAALETIFGLIVVGILAAVGHVLAAVQPWMARLAAIMLLGLVVLTILAQANVLASANTSDGRVLARILLAGVVIPLLAALLAAVWLWRKPL